MGSRGSSWEKPGASSEDEASPRPGSLRVTGTWYPHTFPWEEPMLQVNSYARHFGAARRVLWKMVLPKGIFQKRPLQKGSWKKDFAKRAFKTGSSKKTLQKKHLAKGLCVFSRDQSAQAVGSDPRGAPADANSRDKGYFIPNRGYQQSPETLPSLGTGCLPLWVWEPQQFPRGAPEAVHTQHPISKQREGGVVEDVGDKSWGPSRAV